MLECSIFYRNHHAKNMIPSAWLEQRKAAHGGDAKSLALEMHQHINKIRALRRMSTELPPVWDIVGSAPGQAEKQQKSSLVLYSLPWPSWGMNSPPHIYWGTFAKSPLKGCSWPVQQLLIKSCQLKFKKVEIPPKKHFEGNPAPFRHLGCVCSTSAGLGGAGG